MVIHAFHGRSRDSSARTRAATVQQVGNAPCGSWGACLIGGLQTHLHLHVFHSDRHHLCP